MRRTLLALLAFVPLVLGAPTASAGGNSSYVGGCEYTEGHFYSATVVYSTQQDDNLVTARVTCTLWRGGTPLHSFSIVGVGLVAGQQNVPIYIYDGQTVICTRIDYLSTGDPSDSFCVEDLESDVGDTVFDATAIPDPVLCPVLRTLAPGVPPVVMIMADSGDVYLLNGSEPFWDCPPYGFA